MLLVNPTWVPPTTEFKAMFEQFIGRRRLLSTALATTAGLLLHARLPASAADSADDGYGFLILDAEETDESIKLPSRGNVPIMESHDEQTSVSAIVSTYEYPRTLSQLLPFKLYDISEPPPGHWLSGVTAVGTVAGVWRTAITYSRDPLPGEGRKPATTIDLTAMPHFPRPYPVHRPSLSGFPPPQYTDALPTPGLLVPSANGETVMWIEDGILYQLSASKAAGVGAETLARALVPAI